LAIAVIAATACQPPAARGPSPTAGPAPVAVPAAGTAQAAQPASPAPALLPQNPSPMQELTRRHERLDQRGPSDNGVHLVVEGVLPKAIDVFIPQRVINLKDAPLLIHFMGATWVPQRAVASMTRPLMVAAVFLGSGSGIYTRPFAADSQLYARLLDTLKARIAQVTGAPRVSAVYLSGWSAGYGAIREIVRRPEHLPSVDGVLLIDGIHTSYDPDRKPLADGGVLDTAGLAPFAAFARLAADGSKRFIITHSEIFPGTFASTTECSDWLLGTLALKRVPVLEWGPMGTQLLSRTAKGRLEVLGFAGNTAPDHVDQFHGMAAFVERLLAP
jgi:hypothetical protein